MIPHEFIAFVHILTVFLIAKIVLFVPTVQNLTNSHNKTMIFTKMFDNAYC
jgi:hypothetical protein